MPIAIQRSSKFDRSLAQYFKGNRKRAESYKKALALFTENPRHPSLHLEKLIGSEYWTIRINSSDRLFFIWLDVSNAMFMDIGPHDKYRKY